MENRRTTRRRPNRGGGVVEEASTASTTVVGKRSAAPVNSAASVRASPARKQRTSPVRRSSRPRSTVLGASASSETITLVSATVAQPSPIAEAKEPKPSPKSRNNLPTTLTTNTSSRAPHNKLQATASVHSSYSSSAQNTIEIRSTTTSASSSINEAAGELGNKLGEYLRRSLSKTIANANRRRDGTHTPTTNTEAESRYSRSMSRSIYGDDVEFSDNENNARGDGIEEEEDEDGDEENEHYKSFVVTSTDGAAAAAGTAGHKKSCSPLLAQCRKLEVPREFGGWLGATLLMLLAPPFVYYLQWTCAPDKDTTPDANRCTWRAPDFAAIGDLKYLTESFFQTHVVACYLAFNFVVFLLSALMPATGMHRRIAAATEHRTTAPEYKFNLVSIGALTILAFTLAQLYDYPVAQFVQQHYLRFCLFGFVNAFVVALWAYVRVDLLKSHAANVAQPNVYGRSGNFLIDFALGRQINPKWLGFVEFKLVFRRISLLSTLILACSFCFANKATNTAGQLPAADLTFFQRVLFAHERMHGDVPALVAALSLLMYVCVELVCEHHLASSFLLQGDGFGCLQLLHFAATPFLLGGITKFLFDRHVAVMPPSTCDLVASASSFALVTLGLVLKFLANAIKYKYRMQPTHPDFARVGTIHTFQGRRLLLGRLWGRLRQPNYAGEILALLGLAVQLGARFAWPPLVGLLLIVVLLLHRTRRLQARNVARYHSSWVRYMCQVPYYVLPKVY